MRRLLLTLVALLLLLLAVAPASAQGPTPKDDALARKVAPEVQRAVAQGGKVEFLVVFDEQADLRGANALPDRAAKARYVYDRLKATAEGSQAKALAEVTAAGGQAKPFALVNAALVTGDASLVSRLARRGDVKRLEPNPTVKGVQATPAAPQVAPGPGTPWGIQRVKALAVWDQYTRGAGIVVGIADTGVEWTHPALQPHYRGWNGTTADHSRNWHDAITHGALPVDDYGHGTHVTGTAVGGEGDNRIGVAPDAKWIGCRNMDARGMGTPARYLECMEFMLAPYPPSGTFLNDGLPELGADIINNSWSCPLDEGCYPQTLTQAITTLRAAGILFVAAAGNDGPTCSSVHEPPGLTAETLSVGAFNATGSIAAFSSRGPVNVDGSNRPKPDLTAPGVSVQSAGLGGGYTSGDGTSMASPHVAGVAALLWAAAPALRGQVAATEAILRQTAIYHDATTCGVTIPNRANNTWGWGEVDAFAAIQAALTLGEVRGTLRDAMTSQPLSGARVTLSGPGGLNETVATDSSGQYTFKAAAGAYTLSLTALGYQAATAPATITAGATTTQDVPLTPAVAQAVGGVVSDSGRPVRATVRVAGIPAQAATGADGRYSLSLPPGTYRLRAEAMGYQAAEASVTVTGPTTADMSLRPAAPVLIVDDDEGLDMQQAWLDALGNLGRQADVFEVRATGSGPTADAMQNYCLVIWVVGQKLHRLREADAAQVQAYLERDGRLLLTEPGGAATVFHQTYLRVLPGSGPTASTAQGVGAWNGRTFDIGLPAQLDFPSPAQPAEGGQAVLAWTGQPTYGGIAYLGAYRTLYLTFGLQSLPIAQQTSFVQQALNTLGCPACRLTGDVNFDGRIDVTDIALVAAARGAASSQPAYQRRLDRNLDGVVDDVDVRVVASGWGARCQ